MSESNQINFFSKLSSRSKIIIMAAVFALFAPLPLIMVTPLGLERSWIQILVWLILGGTIATTWAYFYFEQKYMWLPPVFTVFLSFAFPMTELLNVGTPITATWPVSLVAVSLVVIGYVGFVVFISIEGTRSVRLQTEMTIARRIHSYLVPEIEFENEIYEISCVSIASTEMGGDVTDVTEVTGRTCVTIADVSGHGVPAGILMSALKGSLLTSLSSSGQSAVSGRFLDKVNSTFHSISSPDMYCTLTTVVLNPDRSGFIYNAGHTATLHYHSTTKIVDLIDSTGIPIGVMANLECDEYPIKVESGDILALVTDGLTESENKDGKMLGIEALAGKLPNLSSLPTKNITDRLIDFASQFGKTDDDCSVVVVKVK